MLVTAIKPYNAQNGSDRWKISFADDERPLIMTYEPKFSTGKDIPQEDLKLVTKSNEKGEYQYWVPTGKPPQAARKPWRSPEETASIECQTVWKGLVEIFNADKIEELWKSTNPLAVGIRHYAMKRLLRDGSLALSTEGSEDNVLPQL